MVATDRRRALDRPERPAASGRRIRHPLLTALDDLPGWVSSFDLGPRCGAVTPRDDTWDALSGRVVDVDGNGVLRVDAVYTRDPMFRTAEGVGVGSTIDELRTTYGERLVEARPPWPADPPQGGPYAYYQPIAVVYDGDKAITFWLGGPTPGTVVSTVKVSDASFAGDDEFCA